MGRIFCLLMVVSLMVGCQSNEVIHKEGSISSYQPSSKDIVNMHGDITNIDRFFSFVEHVKEGKDDRIRVVTYTEEGDPMLHDLDYDGEVITSTTDTRRDKFGSGGINTTTCASIDMIESKERTDYTLSGCDQKNIDTMILVIWK
ncbi:DUF4362 domain-containing protein [Bacillus timonensis]|nr:DUF4362 domain-containing protein [Bacillus timonensis]